MSKASILIVEDSFIVAFHLKKTLEKEGYMVLTTQPSGEEALAFLEKQLADIVLMDIMLNGKMDGIETARVIKSKFSLPVIYITALTDQETIQRAKITEPYGYLTKPFEDREVFTVIEMALYKHEIESKLRQSEERYFSTVKSISDAVIIIDEQFKITYFNPRAEEMAGMKITSVAGKNIFDYLLIKDILTGEYPVNPFRSQLTQASASSFPENLILISANGTERPIGDGSMSLVVNPKGKIMGMVIIFKDLSEKNEREKLIREFEKRHLSALIESQEKERSRIAKDLHDGLGQMLNAIKMRVNFIAHENEQLKNLYNLIDDAIQESVRISENLVPSKLKDFDLSTCLRSLCGHLEDSSQTHVIFESLGAPQHLEQTQKINLYRIAQEAVNNALKHAKASNISVQLNEESDKIQLTIEDDGLGFKNDKTIDQSKHHGLVNMKERAEMIGGKLTIESDDARGTLIIVEAPVKINFTTHA